MRNTSEQAVGRWVTGIAGSLLVSVVLLGLGVGREMDQGLVEVRRDVDMLRGRVEAIEDALRTNRMTRMAPETRIELDALRRELEALSGRVERLGQGRGR